MTVEDGGRKTKKQYSEISVRSIKSMRRDVVFLWADNCKHCFVQGHFEPNAMDELAKLPLAKLTLLSCALASEQLESLSKMGGSLCCLTIGMKLSRKKIIH